MNSIIEAQEEYFDRQHFRPTPGMPMAIRTFAFYDGHTFSIKRNTDLEKLERDGFDRRRTHHINEQKAKLWDEKLRS